MTLRTHTVIFGGEMQNINRSWVLLSLSECVGQRTRCTICTLDTSRSRQHNMKTQIYISSRFEFCPLDTWDWYSTVWHPDKSILTHLMLDVMSWKRLFAFIASKLLHLKVCSNGHYLFVLTYSLTVINKTNVLDVISNESENILKIFYLILMPFVLRKRFRGQFFPAI